MARIKIAKVQRNCKKCGQSFEVPPSRAKDNRGVFCSNACRGYSRISHNMQKLCAVCGTSFETNKSRRGAKYCSTHCQDIGMIKRESKICEFCGDSYERRPSRMKDKRFCSNSCASKWRYNSIPTVHKSLTEGRPSPFKGIPRADEIKLKISKANTGKPKPWQQGDKNVSKRPEVAFKKSIAVLGAKNPQWNGGTSFLPYCHKFNETLKAEIRERDGHKCQLCGETKNRRKLDVHHIHYDKPNCNPDLIALCSRCNIKANFNRDYFEGLFIKKLTERGLLLS